MSTDADMMTVGALLAVATISQVGVGIIQPSRKGDSRMVQTLRVLVSSALMILVSVSTNIATAAATLTTTIFRRQRWLDALRTTNQTR
jgi:hypothetical protein